MRRHAVDYGGGVVVACFLATALILGGCGKKEPEAGQGGGGGSPAAGESTPAEPPPGEPPAGAAGTASEDGGDGGVETPESAGTATEVEAAVDPEVLAQAYKEIYCAQKLGRTDQILEIYKKYGFETPRAWVEAWRSTSENPAWQADLTREVRAMTCE